MYYAGIDIGKYEHYVTVLEQTKSELKEVVNFSFENTAEGFEKLASRLPEFPGKIAIEATGHYYTLLAAWLHARGYTILLVNPARSKDLRLVLQPRVKTDKVDSFTLAKGLAHDLFTDGLYDQKYEVLKTLAENRHDLALQTTTVKNRIRACLDRIFPEYSAVFKQLFGKGSLAVLHCARTPKRVLELGTEHLQEVLRRASRSIIKKADELVAVASRSIAITDRSSELWLELLLKQHQLLCIQIEVLESRIEEELATEFANEAQLLRDIPGVTGISSTAILGFLGNVKRFGESRASRKVISFAGLSPREFSSGQSVKRRGISKSGPPLLRFYLYWASMTAIRVEGPFREFYRRLVSRGKAKMQALVAVQSKLLKVCYWVLKTGVPYDSELLKPRSQNSGQI